jgi:hypothetical protein
MITVNNNIRKLKTVFIQNDAIIEIQYFNLNKDIPDFDLDFIDLTDNGIFEFTPIQDESTGK